MKAANDNDNDDTDRPISEREMQDLLRQIAQDADAGPAVGLRVRMRLRRTTSTDECGRLMALQRALNRRSEARN